MLTASFLFFLLLFAVVGALSGLQSRRSTADYLVASRSIPAWLAGLSAIATNNSGFMFIGMIGETYRSGLASIWLMVGWIVGDLTVSLLALRPLRIASERSDARSMGTLLARWQGGDMPVVRCLAGGLILIFMSGYAAAQFKAGGKAVEALFAWHPMVGIVLGAALVLLYCYAGGIRASIWTDAAQSFVMLGGMSLLLVVSARQFTSLSAMWEQLEALPGGYMNLYPKTTWHGNVLFITGWLFGGVAVIGQPHIVTRFMALDSHRSTTRMRFYYYGWFIVFYAVTIAVGLCCRLLLAPTSGFDPEKALPLLSLSLLPHWGVGLILAAIFAATMSTADSLILACTSSVSQDFQTGKKRGLLYTKLTTLVVLVISLVMAVVDNQSVFRLVLMAWGLLASAFVPLVVLLSLGRSFRQSGVLVVMVCGVAAFLTWRSLGWGAVIYEAGPGIGLGTLIGLTVSRPRSRGRTGGL